MPDLLHRLGRGWWRGWVMFASQDPCGFSRIVPPRRRASLRRVAWAPGWIFPAALASVRRRAGKGCGSS